MESNSLVFNKDINDVELVKRIGNLIEEKNNLQERVDKIDENHRRFGEMISERIQHASSHQTKAAYEVIRRQYELIHNCKLPNKFSNEH